MSGKDVPCLRFLAFFRGGEAVAAGEVGGRGVLCLVGVLEASARTLEELEGGAGAVVGRGGGGGRVITLMPTLRMW